MEVNKDLWVQAKKKGCQMEILEWGMQKVQFNLTINDEIQIETTTFSFKVCIVRYWRKNLWTLSSFAKASK